MTDEEMIVLACSRKPGGRCLAGIDLETGRWIRPVSDEGGGALTTTHCGVIDPDTGERRRPKHLEIVRYKQSGSCPTAVQPENVLVGTGDWDLSRRLDPEEAYEALNPFLADGPDLFGGYSRGLTSEDAAAAGSSLCIIEPQDLRFFIRQSQYSTKPCAQFLLDGQPYELPVTDYFAAPRILSQVAPSDAPRTAEELDLPHGSRTLLTISLPEPSYYDKSWLLVAAVLCLGE